MLSIAIRLQRSMITLLVISAILMTWAGWASADSSPRFNLFIGTPPPVVIYPAPRVIYPQPVIVEHYPVYHYHNHGGPPPWAASWRKHSKKHWKHQWKHGHSHWHHD